MGTVELYILAAAILGFIIQGLLSTGIFVTKAQLTELELRIVNRLDNYATADDLKHSVEEIKTDIKDLKEYLEGRINV